MQHHVRDLIFTTHTLSQCCQALPPLHLMVSGPETWLCSENRLIFQSAFCSHNQREANAGSKSWQIPQDCTCRTLTHIGVSLTTNVAGSRLLNCLSGFAAHSSNCFHFLSSSGIAYPSFWTLRISPSYRSVSKLQFCIKRAPKVLTTYTLSPNACVVSFTGLCNKNLKAKAHLKFSLFLTELENKCSLLYCRSIRNRFWDITWVPCHQTNSSKWKPFSGQAGFGLPAFYLIPGADFDTQIFFVSTTYLRWGDQV